MNSSSEEVQPASQAESEATSYPLLEYCEAGFQFGDAPGAASEAEALEQPDAAVEQTTTAEGFDAAAEFNARLEQERHAITAQAKLETEREVQQARNEIARAIEQFAHQRDDYFRQAEAEVVNLALAIARRIVHREAQIDPHLLAGLVSYELNQLDDASGVRLVVSSDTLSYWHEAAAAMTHSAEITVDKSLTGGEVRIETALGSTTISLERDLKEIERSFFDLLSRRPVATEPRPARVQ
ncbi:MAG TPA: FliH/SctL family protein [Candidatus Saccharimonadales bacterium]|nr:FliH/SctL family protein [Candidatus Saccharimonadales bacterium]